MVQISFNDSAFEFELVALSCDGLECFGDSVLFALQQVERNCFGIMRLQKLGLLVFELLFTPVERCSFVMRSPLLDLQLVQDHLPSAVEEIRPKFVPGVLLLDRSFNRCDEHRPLVADRPLLLTANADEVLIHLAVATTVMRNDHARAAVSAEDRALQEVVMLAHLLPRSPLQLQNLLHPIPGVFADERLMLAWIFDTEVADDALVVRVLHESMEVAEHQRLARLLSAGCRVEASLGRFCQQVPEIDVAFGVALECPLHYWSPDLVDLDRADLTIVLDRSDVEIPGGSFAHRPASHCFL